MTAERDSMTLNEVSVPALEVEERSDEAPKRVVAEDVEPRHHVHQPPDVFDHRIAEYQQLALVVLAQPLADPLDRLAETPVEVAHGIVQAFLDLVLDVPLDPVGVVRGKLRHEVVGVRDGRDAVADPELALQRLLGGIVLDAELRWSQKIGQGAKVYSTG